MKKRKNAPRPNQKRKRISAKAVEHRRRATFSPKMSPEALAQKLTEMKIQDMGTIGDEEPARG